MMSAHAKVYNYVIKSCVLHMTIKGLQNHLSSLSLLLPNSFTSMFLGKKKKEILS